MYICIHLFMWIYIFVYSDVYITRDQILCLPYVRIHTHTRTERDCNREDQICTRTWKETAEGRTSGRKMVTGDNLHTLQRTDCFLNIYLSLSLSLFLYIYIH